MPGNEVGDRIHNFFGQETSSQGQHHSQIVDGTWQGFSNNAWVGSQRQIGSPLISNLKNLNVPQTADAERGQSSSVQHGVNYTQSALRSELFRSQPQIHQQAVNGYIQGNQVQIRKNEANLLGVDTESDRHSLASRGMSVIDQQLGNGPDVHKKNSMRLESTESPVNYDFFGGQQQMIGQHSMLQPLPRQAPGNMLELLNKVDRSREHGAPTHLSSSDRNRSSEMPDAETSDGSVGHLQQNQSSGSQGFGLQLGPPSQRLSFPDPTLSSQSFSQAVNCLASTRGTSDTAGQSHSWLAPMSSTQSLRPSHEQSEGPNTSTPSHAGDPVQRLPALEAMPAAQPSVSSNTSQQEGVFSKVLPDAWASVSNQQRPLGAQLCKPYSNSLTPQFQSSNNLETSFSDQQKLDENSQKGVEDLSEVGVSLGKSQGLDEKEQPAKEQQLLPGKNSAGPNTMSASHMEGKETYADYSSDTSSSIPTTSQRDIEAFGRSLRPNNTLNDNYSLLHQVLARRSAEIDPSNRSLKRFKGQEDGMESQQVASRGQPLSSINHTSVASRDSKMLNFPSKTRDEHDANVFVHDMVGDSQSQSRDSTAAAVRGDHSYISPHMAPSWFGHYGTFKNGQMLPIYDTQNRGSDSFHVRHPMERVHTFDSSQVGDIRQTTSSSPFSSSQLLPPHTNQNLAIVRPKRKSNNFELVSWGKEVTQGSPRLQNISVAEVGWCRAATRLAEKLEDEAEVFEDCSALFRSKRRLILTTQLMQQLFHPPPASVLSLDATPHYETVAYFIARAALGDACSTLSSSGSDNIVSPDNENLPSDKAKISERIDDPFILKAMEDFINRAKKLENDLLRVDKRASILDLRVEWQELEKFSVINRFAKFHGRGQTDGVETSSSSAAANAQKSSPQRYVTAFPMPRNLPDRWHLNIVEPHKGNVGEE
ncbi:uncharacterized protein LOC110811153 [Carica papaya]|uniref:uncharacterized protein LOC110811153 n=1 Tax=Carica papaya TaxID=3649 RepID=UPI000B8C803F|nr:uncharacterized protein LOC110811153 [Carica papaya]